MKDTADRAHGIIEGIGRLISTDSTLQQGDVAVIIRDGGKRLDLAHNIPAVIQTGEITSPDEVTPLIMATAMVEIVEGDQPAFTAAMIRVMNKMQRGLREV